jgi:hypothetical protein
MSGSNFPQTPQYCTNEPCWPRYANFSFKAGSIQPPVFDPYNPSRCNSIPYFGNRSFRAGLVQPPSYKACLPKYACRSGKCYGLPNSGPLGYIPNTAATSPPTLIANPPQ